MDYRKEGYLTLKEVSDLTGYTKEYIRLLCKSAKGLKETTYFSTKQNKVVKQRLKNVLNPDDVVQIKLGVQSVWLINKQGVKVIKSLAKKGNNKNAKRKQN